MPVLTALFYYTLIVMLIVAIAASVCVSAYFVSRRRTFLYLAISLLFYFFDVSLVFKDSFVTPQTVLDAASFWDVGDPVVSVIFGTGTLLFLWLALCQYVGKGGPVMRFAPAAVFAVASLVAYYSIGHVQWREFVFYSMRTALLLFYLAVLTVWYVSARDAATRETLGRHKVVALVAFLIIICILAEDVYVQLIFVPSTSPSNSWFLAERSFAENMLFVLIALVGMHAAQKTLALRYVAPPERDDHPMDESIDRALPLYAQQRGLSQRESEVLRLVVMGKDNQNIASELQLSPNTVKVHVRNILKKTDQPDRRALTQDFWKN